MKIYSYAPDAHLHYDSAQKQQETDIRVSRSVVLF